MGVGTSWLKSDARESERLNPAATPLRQVGAPLKIWDAPGNPDFSYYDKILPNAAYHGSRRSMPTLTYLQPLDQPFGSGANRAMDWIRSGLQTNHYTSLRLAVAYAKRGALLRLETDIVAFRARGGTIDAVIGFDQGGTSKQALQFALDHFDSVRVWQHPDLGLTFHPKLYIFEGVQRGEIHLGSCNLTAGGLEANCESAVRVGYTLPLERQEWDVAVSGWTSLVNHPNARALDGTLLQELAAHDLLLDEGKIAGLRTRFSSKASQAAGVWSLFPPTTHRPSSPLPRPPRPSHPGQTTLIPSPAAASPGAVAPASVFIPEALLIQIVPHHNGEVFLSKQAVDQQHAFFGYPWTGATTPKKQTNAPYVQRTPDPQMEWTVFDRQGQPILHVPRRGINTVFYVQRAEIRITVSPDLRNRIVPLSILQMERADPTAGLDYVCEVHPPASPQFNVLFPLCNQTMPSGGAQAARRFGWI
jgi:hypothetical protein